MKTNQIADVIINSLADKGFQMFSTSITIGSMHECDVLGINQNEYIYEFEIKRSRSDYKADFKKTNKHRCLKLRDSHRFYNIWEKGKMTGQKYKSINIPNRFFYVCESGLINLDEIPEYAGLIYIEKDGSINEIKNAPLLHKQKATKQIYKGLARILSQRIIYGCAFYTYKNKKK